MRIALGADHAGFLLKEDVKRYLAERHVPFVDFGTDSDAPVDYPDYAARVARAVASRECDRGILVCRSGIGMSIAANKVRGIRAAVVADLESARLGREHNDANVLALPGQGMPYPVAREIVRIFLETPFAGGRHQRRVDAISRLETQPDEPVRPDSPAAERSGL
jgi:ribose 5-phosphate isomerase B